uniref:RFTS domain-containing protein n=1 Tax=Leersia perrieri TaxID=77586 RepID=A0A0D9X6T2_9ORYZ
MALFGDDDDELPQLKGVNKYYCKDHNDDFVCFSILPFWFDEKHEVPNSELIGAEKIHIYGSDREGQHVCKRVIAWRVELDCKMPKMSVLSSEGNWIRLLEPHIGYAEDFARSVLITIQMIHFVRRHPAEDERTLSNHLCEVFWRFVTKPPEVDDLQKNYPLIIYLLENDPTLMKSKILKRLVEDTWTIIEVNARGLSIPSGKMAENLFVKLFVTLLVKKCLLSFAQTANISNTNVSNVESLVLRMRQILRYFNVVTHLVGTSTIPTVWQDCLNLLMLIKLVNGRNILRLECHLHVQYIGALNVTKWRTGPKGNCGLREISFEKKDVTTRAWEIPKEDPKIIFIYCMDHDINATIKTPHGDHIKFPDPSIEKAKDHARKKIKVTDVRNTDEVSPEPAELSAKSCREEGDQTHEVPIDNSMEHKYLKHECATNNLRMDLQYESPIVGVAAAGIISPKAIKRQEKQLGTSVLMGKTAKSSPWVVNSVTEKRLASIAGKEGYPGACADTVFQPLVVIEFAAQ